jgi:hypothetical protein
VRRAGPRDWPPALGHRRAGRDQRQARQHHRSENPRHPAP